MAPPDEANIGRAAHKKNSACCSRREFLGSVWILSAGALAGAGCASLHSAGADTVIDIHQHVGYAGRTNEELVSHQDAMGVARTILLPSGRAMRSASTHQGVANGLQASAGGNESCYRLAKAFPRRFYFAANEVPDAPEASREIEKYLKLGAVAIAEQKFGVECDSPEMQRLYAMAADYRVPILMHWQHQMYNFGFERFHKMLEKHPRTIFIGHAQTWWANVGQEHTDQAQLYPKGKVTPGGMTDRYLRDYANMYGDLSAGSGLNSLTRDEEHARGFLERHQDKLLYGSDCNDRDGTGTKCIGWQTIQTVRRLAPSREIARKILRSNAKRIFPLV
jgi:predicted TIM-barrel fold metal-dependent hydrolase